MGFGLPLLAALGGWLVLQEVLTTREFIGCALMLAGMLASQLQRRERPASGAPTAQ